MTLYTLPQLPNLPIPRSDLRPLRLLDPALVEIPTLRSRVIAPVQNSVPLRASRPGKSDYGALILESGVLLG